MTTNAVVNQSAVNFYANLSLYEYRKTIYAMAGKIAMDGCSHGRLCIVHSMHAAAVFNAGPADLDADWGRYALPIAARLVRVAEEAYSAA